MKTAATHNTDLFNIVLLIVSCIVAAVVPFQLFLFVYAVLGPLHYLTEISWLHDKNYFSNNKKDVLLLVLVSSLVVVLILLQLNPDTKNAQNAVYIARLTFIGLGSALFMAYVSDRLIKYAGIGLLILLCSFSDSNILFLVVMVPSVVHVFIFTFFFMLLGALRSHSKPGYAAAVLHLAIPFIFYYLLQYVPATAADSYSLNAFQPLKTINMAVISQLDKGAMRGDMNMLLFHSPLGIAVMRFLAFAYTYHYLNWFSKTKVIRWHKVPRMRLAVVVLVWIASIILYAVNYSMGLKWLLLLSFMHVALEWPLNFISIGNIGKELKARFAGRQ
jgi:hypothetical protein